MNLQNGCLDESQWEQAAQSVGRLSELSIYIDDSPVISVSSIGLKVKRIVAEYGRIGMIGIDYLQLMEGTVGKLINRHKSVPQSDLIAHLNPIIRGWTNYYSGVVVGYIPWLIIEVINSYLF